MRERQPRPPPVEPKPASAEDLSLRLAVHDLSRLEWTATLALPAVGERRYDITFECELPANLFSPVNLWDYIQQFTRLQSPSEEGAVQVDRGDPDELRRDVLGVAHRLKILREKFERASAAAASQLVEALHPSLQPMLLQFLDQANAVVAEMRTHLLREPSDAGHSTAELRREWDLADEFISHQLLDFYAQAEKAKAAILLGPHSRLRELDVSWTESISDRIATHLEAELSHRRERGFIIPRLESPGDLSRFVERGSHLKKHFQDVLFLDVSAYMVDFRLRNWTGIVAAAIAAAFWLSFTLLPIGPGTRAGISLGTFGVIFAVAYALKDRVKEMTRGWLAGRLQRLYGQRQVTLRLPQRIDVERSVIVEARETCQVIARQAADPLTQHIGAQRRVMVEQYQMRADLHACPEAAATGIRNIKHIFRFDLTPIFSRLDNAVKSVPVLDPETRRVKFVDAPKEYRLPLKLRAISRDQVVETDGVLVVSKRGIERLEPVTRE